MYMGLMMIGQQKYITAELLLPALRTIEVEMAIVKLNTHKSPGTDQIPAEIIEVVGRTIQF
jgi:hypothetical protein